MCELGTSPCTTKTTLREDSKKHKKHKIAESTIMEERGETDGKHDIIKGSLTTFVLSVPVRKLG